MPCIQSSDNLLDAPMILVGLTALSLEISTKLETFLETEAFAIANVLALNMIHDLPSTYLEDYVSNVNKVTLEDVNKAISRYMKLNPLVSVVYLHILNTDGAISQKASD